MSNIIIMTDTASDIDLETAKKYGIHLIPINISFDGVNFKDRYELTSGEFYERLKSGVIPKTSQITVAEHYEEFKKYEGNTVIYIPLSARASGTYQSANIAKQTLEDEGADIDINIIECTTFTYGYGMWVIKAAQMAKDGSDKQQIIDMLNENIKNTEIILTVDDLKYLQKGGRISSSAKLVASVLDIKPILAIEDGLVMSRDKVRGSKKVFPKMIEILKADAKPDVNQTIAVMHGNCPEKAETVANLIKEKTEFKNIITVEVGPCIGVHTGAGVIGVAYLKK